MAKSSRGGKYAATTSQSVAQAQQQQQINQQPPTPQNTPVKPNALKTLQSMSDDNLAQLVKDAKTASLPNFLNDRKDLTQQVVYKAGLNDLPVVLDDAAFNKYMKDNNIPQSDILARSVDDIRYTNQSNAPIRLTATQIIDMMKYSRLNYVGGKYGGQVYGGGTYFDKNGGRGTAYGSGATAIAILNPKTAKVITKDNLKLKAQKFAKTHPKFVKTVGTIGNNNLSVYALAMGYNVIKSDINDYHNVIDRSALIYRKSNK